MLTQETCLCDYEAIILLNALILKYKLQLSSTFLHRKIHRKSAENRKRKTRWHRF